MSYHVDNIGMKNLIYYIVRTEKACNADNWKISSMRALREFHNFPLIHAKNLVEAAADDYDSVLDYLNDIIGE